jgi:hypothetical protein
MARPKCGLVDFQSRLRASRSIVDIASVRRRAGEAAETASEMGHSRRFAVMLQRHHTFQSGRPHRWQHRYHPHMYKPGSVRRSPVMPGGGRSDPIAAVRRLSQRPIIGSVDLKALRQAFKGDAVA